MFSAWFLDILTSPKIFLVTSSSTTKTSISKCIKMRARNTNFVKDKWGLFTDIIDILVYCLPFFVDITEVSKSDSKNEGNRTLILLSTHFS